MDRYETERMIALDWIKRHRDNPHLTGALRRARVKYEELLLNPPEFGTTPQSVISFPQRQRTWKKKTEAAKQTLKELST